VRAIRYSVVVSLAVLARALVLLVAIAPGLRAMCDVSCIDPGPPPSCHQSAPDPEEDDCDHDHAALVARLSGETPFVAVLPVLVTFAAPVGAPATHADIVVQVASRTTPSIVLRV